ncbi:PhzF family phenazine biosynthesis protein [soil metagenome]
MNRHLPFAQVDVFTDVAYLGNPVAVVLDADGLDDASMQRIAGWTNLSETTFVLTPTTPDADYRVRIFTPVSELPFAGHPTLGTCHAWSAHTGRRPTTTSQQCPAGLVQIRRHDDRLAFAAPPLVRSGPVDDATRRDVITSLGAESPDVIAVEWADNGPGWIAVLLRDADAVLAVQPAFTDRFIGVAGPHPAGSSAAIEVRAFFPMHGSLVEDPVTGSLNASLGQLLVARGDVDPPYIAAQGQRLGRAGRVHVTVADDTVWVGGGTVTLIEGQLLAG